MSKLALALFFLTCSVRALPDVRSQELQSLARMLHALNQGAAFSLNPVHARTPVINRHRASAAARLVPERSPAMVTTLAPEPVTSDERLALVRKHFPSAEYMEDFVTTLQSALAPSDIGISKENSIAFTTLCRDDRARPFQDKLESTFGQSFNSHGLTGLAYLGESGMKAALSHSPKIDGKERYIFFALSQVDVDSEGNVKSIAPGKEGADHLENVIESADYTDSGLKEKLPAAVMKTLREDMKLWGEDIPADFDETTVLNEINLVDLTKVAASLVEDELVSMIKAVVDPEKADYAVVTGVQIHSRNGGTTLEFVAPTKAYAMVGGEEKEVNLMLLSQLSSLLGSQTRGFSDKVEAQKAEIEELKKQLKLQTDSINSMKDTMQEPGANNFNNKAVTAAIAVLAGVACGAR